MSNSLKQEAMNKTRKKSRWIKIRLILIVIILFLVNIYVILGIIYKGENFTVTLDSEYGRKSGLIIYEDPSDKSYRTYLTTEKIDFFTDISIKWLPSDIDNEGNGSHNGKNYMAYTFYAENAGQDTINYWATIEIDDVIKNVDEAVRVMVIKNGNSIVYAKKNKTTLEAEKGTNLFYSDDTVMLEHNENFEVGDIDKYTLVIWIEGDDPECLNDLIGGEIKMHMQLTEEHIE
jgi:hypothetical protein